MLDPDNWDAARVGAVRAHMNKPYLTPKGSHVEDVSTLSQKFGAHTPNEPATNWVVGADLFMQELQRVSEYASPAHRMYNFTVQKVPMLSATDDLKRLFDEHHSDKSQPHKYHIVYGQILHQLGRMRSLRILEIGLGTNSSGAVGSMAKQFGSKKGYARPGASHRAWRDFLPNASVFGADLDRKALFSEERIDTEEVNQLVPESVDKLYTRFGAQPFDLFIDDGLHSIAANMVTLNFALRHVRLGGYIVIEDVPLPLSLPRGPWDLVDRALSGNPALERAMIGCGRTGNGARMYVVHKRAPGGPRAWWHEVELRS